LQSSQNIQARYGDKVVDLITSRCTEVDTGARNIDHILRATLIPQLSSAILSQMAEGNVPESMVLDVDEQNNFTTTFGAAQAAE
jgi:type VI secretion system protein VasG